MSLSEVTTEIAGTDTAFGRFSRIHADAGLRAALGYLGAFTGWRCAAVIRIAGAELQSLAYFDRDRPELLRPEVWLESVRASCLVQGRDGRVREAAGAAEAAPGADAQGAPVPDSARPPGGMCLCVPVIDRDGRLHASLCLFDDACGHALETDLALLLRVAASLAAGVSVHAGSPLRPPPKDDGWRSALGEEDPGSALDELPLHRAPHPWRG